MHLSTNINTSNINRYSRVSRIHLLQPCRTHQIQQWPHLHITTSGITHTYISTPKACIRPEISWAVCCSCCVKQCLIPGPGDPAAADSARSSTPLKVICDCCDVMSEMGESIDTIKSAAQDYSCGRLLSRGRPRTGISDDRGHGLLHTRDWKWEISISCCIQPSHKNNLLSEKNLHKRGNVLHYWKWGNI